MPKSFSSGGNLATLSSAGGNQSFPITLPTGFLISTDVGKKPFIAIRSFEKVSV